ncbi:MAG TPA: phospholipid carrier-dependent glycosyltransferase, partial [Anaerolineae bacterium]|nr:phospholipid carrier-dependent glycosyltransferase [Anaerolineae bacterium]
MRNNHKLPIAQWLGLGLLLWLFIAFGLFYLVQKPFTPAAAAAIAKAVLDLLAAAWLGLLGLGLGHRLLYWIKRLKPSNLPTLRAEPEPKAPCGQDEAFQPSNSEFDLSIGELLVLGCGLGLGVLALITLGLGLAGLFYRWLFIVISLLLTLALWPDFLALSRRVRRPANRPHRLTTIYLVAIGLFILATALLPPIDWDGLFYHLTAPKIFIQARQITPGLDVPHFNFPFLAEMLFAYAMLLRGDIAAKLIHTLYGLLLTGLVYLIARRHLSRESAWPAVLIFLSMPMVVTLAGWAYNDLALAFYQLAALYAWLNYQFPNSHNPNSQTISQISQAHPGSNSSWLILSGLFAGLAMGLKYTSFVGPLTIGLFLVWYQVAGRRLQRSNPQTSAPQALSFLPFTIRHSPFAVHHLRPLFYFALPALLIALPWYLKNFFFTG